jgi:hypothetical protein
MNIKPPTRRAVRLEFQRPMQMTRDEKATVYTNAQLLTEAKGLMDRAVARGWAKRPELSPMEVLRQGAGSAMEMFRGGGL